jgi:hypothetical protein
MRREVCSRLLLFVSFFLLTFSASAERLLGPVFLKIFSIDEVIKLYALSILTDAVARANGTRPVIAWNDAVLFFPGRGKYDLQAHLTVVNS